MDKEDHLMSKSHGKKDSRRKTDSKEKAETGGLVLSRRTMVKVSAAAGAGTVLAPHILTSRKSTVLAQGTVAEPILCAPTPVPQSPAHTPFVDNLPVPSPAVPVFLSPAPTKQANTLNGE